MATFDFNTLMEQAKSASFEPLPAGPYDAECISADAATSSTGKPMIKCKFEVISGPHAKRKFFNQYVLSTENETALAMFFRQMKAFGMDENFFAAVGSGGLGPVAQTMLGKRARFELGIREWQGEPRNEVKSTKPLAGGIAASLPGLPGGLPTSAAPAAVPSSLPGVPAAPPVVQTPPTPAQPVPPATAPPQAAAPVNPAQSAVAQPVPPPAAVVTEPAPPVQPAAPVQPVEAPAPVQAPVQPIPAVSPAEQPAAPVAPAVPAQPEPQPTPPAEQVAVGAPAVAPPPPMPF